MVATLATTALAQPVIRPGTGSTKMTIVDPKDTDRRRNQRASKQAALKITFEPLRESCRLQPLRGWSHGKYFEEVRVGGS